MKPLVQFTTRARNKLAKLAEDHATDMRKIADAASKSKRKPAKTKPAEPQRLSNGECESMLFGLLCVIRNPNAEHPSELIELIDKAIDYVTAVERDELSSIGELLDELIEARKDYRGPGVYGGARR